ncbi:MAG: hypothetical protein Tsb0034_27680 [Ekhidna sp.]
MYFALPHKEYLRAKGEDNSHAPRLSLYQAFKNETTWSDPELLPFSGKYQNYEPEVTGDGNILFFNSNQPLEGNAPLEKNNIWFSERKDGVWTDAKSLPKLNTDNLEESYTTISDDGTMIYAAEQVVDGRSEYSLYQTKFEGTNTLPGVKLEILNESAGAGDPCLSKDGSFLIFTRFDQRSWQSTCDLYISFWVDDQWSKPMPLDELNSVGPDYAAALSPDMEWIYYRKNYSFIKQPFRDILSRYQALSN